jgi:PIN domain nuclease of toxin-antitoxin system
VRLLIDTHILLWADQRPRLIVPTLRAAMRHETNEIVVSAATVSEIGPYGVATLGLDRSAASEGRLTKKNVTAFQRFQA